jgi:hypothetical protein
MFDWQKRYAVANEKSILIGRMCNGLLKNYLVISCMSWDAMLTCSLKYAWLVGMLFCFAIAGVGMTCFFSTVTPACCAFQLEGGAGGKTGSQGSEQVQVCSA